ncbi:hypothetical protein F511_33255 [Dorcoceras hygrometricum]|uniref:Uncharacterized protein n=1 Tax=Dorcoceras hygrometricum TaxID=472368 RepID=A0A2Z7AQ73_9LAMI|nr:hypothetical protein F511_33255 [Dorcoceras hygrometricum]
MASSLYVNTVHVCFDSVLAMDNIGMVEMFESLTATGLKGFLGCPVVIHEVALLEFFENGSVRDGLVVSTVNGVTVEISEQLLAETFELPVEGLTDLSEIPKDIVFDARSIVSLSGEPVSTSGKKKEMKIEFRLLCDILAKIIFVKAGSFDAITQEKFLMMSSITCGRKQCIDISLNDKVGGEEVADVPRVKRTPVKKAVSKKRLAVATATEPVGKKKMTSKNKSVSAQDNLAILPVAQVLATMADPDPVSLGRSENQKLPRETFNTFKYNSININRVFIESLPCWRPRSESRHLRQPALEGLKNSAWMETPRRGDRNKSDHVDGGTRRRHGAAQGGGRRREVEGEEGRPSVNSCVTLNGSGIQLAVGPQPLRLRNHNFGLAHRIMVKRLATSPHDPLGINDSSCNNQLVMVSVQYGPFNTYIPIRSTTIGKSRVAKDPITMHTSWRSNSDITSVTRASMAFRVVRTNQYNQDLGLFHSTNGNHLESPNEGSSIDHQVTIHLHAQNITMFPTNETWQQYLYKSLSQLLLHRLSNPSAKTQTPEEEKKVAEETVVEGIAEPVSEPAVADVANAGISTADDVDIIIGQVLDEAAQIGPDEEEQYVGGLDVAGTAVSESGVGQQAAPRVDELEQWFNLYYEEFHSRDADQPVVTASDTDEEMETVDFGTGVEEQQLQIFDAADSRTDATADYTVTERVEEMETEAVEQSADEAMSLEDILMTIPIECPFPSANVEITPITLGKSISIPGVHEGDWYKAGLPKIPATDKRKAPLQERDQLRVKIPQRIVSDEVSRHRSYDDTLPPVSEFFKLMKKRWGDNCIEAIEFSVSGKLLPVGSITFCRALSVVEPVPNFGSRRQTVITLGWSQLCTAFVQYSLLSGLSTDDIRSFFIASSAVEDQNVQLLLDQRPHYPSTTADSSMHFVEDDIQLEDDSAPDQFILTSSATAISSSIADLRESFSNLVANQSRDSRKTNNALSEVLCKIDHIERVFLDSLAEQNETFRGLFKRSRQEAQNDNNALSLALKAVRTQNVILSTDLEATRKEVKDLKAALSKDFDDKLADIRNELLEFYVETHGQLASLSTHLAELTAFLTKDSDDKKGEDSSSRRPQPPSDDQSRPIGGSGGSGNRADEQSHPVGSGTRECGGLSESQRRVDSSGSSKRRRSSGESPVRGIRYGPYPPGAPPKRSAKYWMTGEKDF